MALGDVMHLAGKLRSDTANGNQSGNASPSNDSGNGGQNGGSSSTDKVSEMQASFLKKLDDVAEKITKPKSQEPESVDHTPITAANFD
eukprot:5350903-Karenia_brevis.AAC.1